MTLNFKEPLVYIIILNYNGTDDTLECLRSLVNLDYESYMILVIDNGSRDSCIPAVHQLFPGVETMESGDNLGFAGGCNLGITRAMERKADYVWLLNNDTVVDPSALKVLVKELETSRIWGIAGSKALVYGSKIIDSAGGRIFPYLIWRGVTCNIGSGQIDAGQFDQTYPVDFIPGSSMLVKTQLITEIGLMDERYFLYFEETDWCIRARKSGWQLRYVSGSIIYHKVSRSIIKKSPLQTYYAARNSLFFMRRHYPWLLWTLLYWWPRYFLVGHWLHGRRVHLRYCRQAFRDFIRNKSGKMEGMIVE